MSNLQIKVLGPGCHRCIETKRHVAEALNQLKVEADVVEVKNPREIWNHGAMSTPAVIIDGRIMSQGRIPSSDEIKMWLAK